jgi:hypothetical protein|tara:strand:- start:333 stop:605 length:273 start_codon:yes stop_codon:yes gene_type:complete
MVVCLPEDLKRATSHVRLDETCQGAPVVLGHLPIVDTGPHRFSTLEGASLVWKPNHLDDSTFGSALDEEQILSRLIISTHPEERLTQASE